jgi:integrase
MKGSILKRGKNTYLIRFFAGRDPITGKESRPTKTVHGSKKDAERRLREWIVAYESGQFRSDQSFTLNQHLKNWKANTLPGAVEESTAAAYAYDIDRMVTNTIGRLPISKLRPLDIQNFYIGLVANGTGPSSVKRLHAALRKAFKNALVLQLVTHNPTVGVEVPGQDKVKKRPNKPMNPEQALQFLEAAGRTPWLALFELALSTGMRPQEYLGLPWSCVDWEKGRVRVTQAVSWPRGGTAFISKTKTKSGRRTIPVPAAVLESLKEHRLAQNQHRLRMGDKWKSENDLVFPNDHGGIWNKPNFTKTAFKEVLRLAQLKGFTPYSLRHSCATLLLLEGENPKVVSERLGHSGIRQTLDTYSHVLPTMQKSASDRLNRLLFRSS